MTDPAPKAVLHRYLHTALEDLRWKQDGLSEYDARRPLTATGTNLLGLLKHVATVLYGYFGDTFDRPHDEPLPWVVNGAADNGDMWATSEESREQILALYQRAWSHADATIAALELASPGRVPWWPEHRADVTLQQIMVHVIADTDRHLGHADILREHIDGSVGLLADNSNVPPADAAWWQNYRAQVEDAAREATN